MLGGHMMLGLMEKGNVHDGRRMGLLGSIVGVGAARLESDWVGLLVV